MLVHKYYNENKQQKEATMEISGVLVHTGASAPPTTHNVRPKILTNPMWRRALKKQGFHSIGSVSVFTLLAVSYRRKQSLRVEQDDK